MIKKIWICAPALLLLGALMAGRPIANNLTSAEVRAPFARFTESGITATRAEGWLNEFLQRQRSGLTGHPDVLSYPFNTCLWAGEIKREGENHGDNWWRYEQTAYYTDGLIRLGYELKDTAMIHKAEEGIDYTINHPLKNGRLGFESFTSQWPICVFFRAMQAEYQATGNQRILEALHRHYLTYNTKELGTNNRAIINLEGALWVYGKTHDQRLLDTAEKAFSLGGFTLNLDSCNTDRHLHIHGVSYMEMTKLPLLLYSYTGKKLYLDAALNAMGKLDKYEMQPDGIPSSNEFLGGKDPLQSHETCDISDYTWSAGYFLAITGNPVWADHIERAVFNAGPGAVSKDFKNLQYFSSVNQVIATGNSNQNKFNHGSTWMAYWPCHETECCAGNVHRFMPNYVARMWMRDAKGAPVAALYGPSTETVNYGGQTFHIHENTGYPFNEQISFTFDMASPLDMPFTLRVPGWCKTPSLNINGRKYAGALKPGSFVTLNRKFAKTDRITLQLPMQAQLLTWGNWGQAVERGPLLYAFAVPEKVNIDTKTYANLNGKHSPDPSFPALDIRPDGDWNYALAVNNTDFASKVKIVKTQSNGYPLDPGQSPLVIAVPAKKVKDWSLTDERYTPAMPVPGSYKTGKQVKKIILVPYGSTRLRLTVFPKAE